MSVIKFCWCCVQPFCTRLWATRPTWVVSAIHFAESTPCSAECSTVAGMPILSLGTAAEQSSYNQKAQLGRCVDCREISGSRTLCSDTKASRLGTASPSSFRVVLYCARSFVHSGVYLLERPIINTALSTSTIPKHTRRCELYRAHTRVRDDPS